MSRVALPPESKAGAPRAIDLPGHLAEQIALFGADGYFRDVLEALPAAIYTTDAQGRITFYNKAAIELAGREPKLGSDEWCVSWRLYSPDGTPMRHDECPMAIALRENRPIRGVEAIAERPDGTRVPFLPFPTPIRDSSGKLIGAVNMLVDISDRNEAETKVHALMKELHHRVKNNMQMMQSLLGAAEREASNPEARKVLGDAVRRVGAMAAAQQGMYSASPLHFDVQPFMESLGGNANRAFGAHADIAIECASGVLSNDAAVPLALIVNELISNAVTHGRAGRSRVAVNLSLVQENGEWVLSVSDDGPGFELKETGKRASGLGLVSGLARQLGGTLQVTGSPGVHCVVRFGRARNDPK
ncbi:MAG TPA: histidine kinase dimerization/phosphoacceptor domain -containing protein [Micropepsaceae bacterium]|nr:histidine kinase dimerization/phosphoacceptor domain -containing protein [Micropepsaceae bacterium]